MSSCYTYSLVKYEGESTSKENFLYRRSSRRTAKTSDHLSNYVRVTRISATSQCQM